MDKQTFETVAEEFKESLGLVVRDAKRTSYGLPVVSCAGRHFAVAYGLNPRTLATMAVQRMIKRSPAKGNKQSVKVLGGLKRCLRGETAFDRAAVIGDLIGYANLLSVDGKELCLNKTTYGMLVYRVR